MATLSNVDQIDFLYKLTNVVIHKLVGVTTAINGKDIITSDHFLCELHVYAKGQMMKKRLRNLRGIKNEGS